jgi:hypothetical protein
VFCLLERKCRSFDSGGKDAAFAQDDTSNFRSNDDGKQATAKAKADALGGIPTLAAVAKIGHPAVVGRFGLYT